jgi:hypothetical protein
VVLWHLKCSMDRHRILEYFLGVVGSSGVSGLGLMSVSVDKFDADLLGQSEFNLLASGSSQLGLAFVDGLSGILNLGDGDAFLLGEIFTADAGQRDGLVDAGLDGLGVGHLDGNIDGGDDGHVVSGLLSDLLAVVVSVRVSITVSLVSGLADGDHLDIGLLLEGDLNSLAGGVFVLLLVRIRADLLGDLFDRLSANSSGDSVAEFLVDNALDGQFDGLAGGLEGGGADFGDFSHILDSAVVLGLFIAITSIVGGGGVSISRGRGGVAIGRGSVVGGSLVVATISGSGVVGHSQSQGQKGQDSESLVIKS